MNSIVFYANEAAFNIFRLNSSSELRSAVTVFYHKAQPGMSAASSSVHLVYTKLSRVCHVERKKGHGGELLASFNK